MKIKIFGIDSEIVAENEVNGVRVTLYKSIENIGIVVIKDTESGNLVGIKKFVAFNEASDYYKGCVSY